MKRLILLSLLPVLLCGQVAWNGFIQVSGSGLRSTRDQSAPYYFFKGELTALPGLEWNFWQSGSWTADMEWRVQAYADMQNDDGTASHSGEIDLYRGWMRLYSPFTEFRIGYQQLNFGPGRMVRTLNWFDSISYLDPQKMTGGVWGARMQLFYRNNANVWVWMLSGNKDDKYSNWLIRDDVPEWGGRVEIPVMSGEIGVSGHYREISDGTTTGIERHYGLDGMWDPFIGIWFESSLMNTDADDDSQIQNWLEWNHVTGIDYTFGIGNGLNVAGEWSISGTKPEPADSDSLFQDWTLQNSYYLYASYPVTIFDQCLAAISVSKDVNYASAFLNWTRTTDDWTVGATVSQSIYYLFEASRTNRFIYTFACQLTRYF